MIDISEQNDQNQENSSKSEGDAEHDFITKKVLRRDLKMWIRSYENINVNTICPAMKELAELRSRYRSCRDWEKEALSLRYVQERMRQAAHCVKNIVETKQRSEVAEALRRALTLSEDIQVPFPSLLKINECVLQIEGNSSLDHSFKLNNVEQLPGHLKACLEQMGAQVDQQLKQLHCELEATMKGWSKRKAHCYEYQTSVGVLHLFGFDLTDFSFQSWLLKEDFISISKMLEIHLTNVKSTPQKQAYVLNIALCSVEKKAGCYYVHDQTHA